MTSVDPDGAIVAQRVHKTYHLGSVEVRALEDVSVTAAPGEMICIMGKSGSGKSTLLRQLSLIDRPTAGEVLIDGVATTGMRESRRAQLRLERLGYVFQEYALIPELTATENVLLPALQRDGRAGRDRDRAAELLDAVGLGDRLHHRPKELSGGQQQRVAIARALVNSPSIVFADEPTANLDSASGKAVMDTLTRLNRETGITVLFVSHDPDYAVYASRLIHLADGHLVEEATP
ncbi:MAG: ABC transporter ATP-binding protein [Dietzia sp.]|uniref:ABC transporter ATP-binding protein n=1 Tax=Demequina sp. TaxID=2050685 RepID=UPI0019BC2207|nr:ABC transporter ATP-binding protein [Demequina sp.]MBC7297978.1 ABC transporter ATP-binding protein [Demequina sp.]MBC7308223.1 ABC transporter ATP-binding protein [Dietzia sp.]